MKYILQINQGKSLEWGLNTSESMVFSWLYELPSWAETVTLNGDHYYFASRHKAIEELPLVTDKPDTMYRFYKTLSEKGLILIEKVGLKEYVFITKKGKSWYFSSEESEKNPSKVGKKSELGSENFPTYKDTISDKDINDTYTPPAGGMYASGSNSGSGVNKNTDTQFVPPSEQEVVDYFTANNYLASVGSKAFRYYSEANWRDSSGKKIKNWKQKMQGVWFKDENKSVIKSSDGVDYSKLLGYKPKLHGDPNFRFTISPAGNAIIYERI